MQTKGSIEGSWVMAYVGQLLDRSRGSGSKMQHCQFYNSWPHIFSQSSIILNVMEVIANCRSDVFDIIIATTLLLLLVLGCDVIVVIIFI